MSGGFIGPVNLGNPTEFTVKELAETVLELVPGSKSRIVYKELPSDDPRRRRPGITLAKEKLKWEPKIPLHEGLRRTIDYFAKLVTEQKPQTKIEGTVQYVA